MFLFVFVCLHTPTFFADVGERYNSCNLWAELGVSRSVPQSSLVDKTMLTTLILRRVFNYKLGLMTSVITRQKRK